MKWRRVLGVVVVSALAGFAGAARAAVMTMIGFYAPWDGASLASLQQHAGQLQAVIPAWVSVTGPDHEITIVADPAGRAALAMLKTPLWLMVQNARLGSWDGPGAAALFRDKAATETVLDQLEAEGVRDKASGLVIDFEDLAPSAKPDLPAFLALARGRCHRHGWVLAVTAPVSNPDRDLSALAKSADRVILMAYDEHWQSGPPGPIASDPWFDAVVRQAMTRLPPAKAVVAVASYAYDWPAAGPATILSIPQAQTLAAQNGLGPDRDPTNGEARFAYTAAGVAHRVWMSDAAAVRRQTQVAQAVGARAVALWRLGSEDPAIWSASDAAGGR